MKCEFKDTDIENIKKCSVCGFEWATKHPADKLNRTCPEQEPRGLGDTIEANIEKITFGYGLKIAEIAAHSVGLEDCGCAGRKEFLNKLFPSNKSSNGV